MAANDAATLGVTKSSNPSPELKGGDLTCLFSRETSASEEHTERPLTFDSLPSAGSSGSDKEDSKKGDQCDTLSGDESLEGDCHKDQAPCADDAVIGTISGLWWGPAGERYNVQEVARGHWRCVRRGPQMGSQRIFAMTCEAGTGRVVWGKAFTLDASNLSEEQATWRSIDAIKGKRRKFTWSRSKPSQVEDESADAAELNEVDEGKAYSRSFLLRVRLQIGEAEQGSVPLGISCRSNTQQLQQQLQQLQEQQQQQQQQQQPRKDAAEDKVDETAGMTTVMLRNLPNQCTRGMLVKWLCTTEFDGEFDLVYVPLDRTSGNNLGYSFINFTEASACKRFIATMHGMKAAKCFVGSRSGKVLQCNYAKVQGKEPYCQGLANAANKLSAMGCGWAAAETLDPVPKEGGSGLPMTPFAPVMPMGIWHTPAEQRVGDASSKPSSAKFEGMRREAPEFVPGQLAKTVDNLLEALTGMSMTEFQNTHTQAAARAKEFSAKLYVPGELGGECGGIFVPPRDAGLEERSVKAS